MDFLAHSSGSGATQKLSDHLANVAVLAAQFAQQTRPGDDAFRRMAEWAGAFHDLGKYTDDFQRRIRGENVRCPHAIQGASYLCLGESKQQNHPEALLSAWAIAAHHAGLTDVFAAGNNSFLGRIRHFHPLAVRVAARAREDCPALAKILGNSFPAPSTIHAQFPDLTERMLFSCLVDADRLDSSGRSWGPVPLCAAERLQQLQEEIFRLSEQMPESCVKLARQRVLRDCICAATIPGGLFSLTVPTGGGKTLASMAFALRRAAQLREKYQRIIVVIPYLSIIEQTAKVYRTIFGANAVLEHHSGAGTSLRAAKAQDAEIWVPADLPKDDEAAAEMPDRRYDETENWDAPLIVTTSVRFFESLFYNRPADLRRVHNVARSIVILDEVQTLPRQLLEPLLGMIGELAEHWNCAFVFSTATQPAFERENDNRHDRRLPRGAIREIIQPPEQLRAMLKRVHITWKMQVPMPWNAVAERMLGQPQSLCIVNLRDHAAELYKEVLGAASAKAVEQESVFHLSTRMCAAHRLEILEIIRERLTKGLPCHVISTQLVEAGVDVDFPLVMRALAPLDAVIQAAGRADREGRITAQLGKPGGHVIVFRTVDGKVPPGAYREATEVTSSLADAAKRLGKDVQVDSAAALADYYKRYYGDADLGSRLAAHARARQARIRQTGRRIRIDQQPHARCLCALRRGLRVT